MKKPHKIIVSCWDEDLSASLDDLSDQLEDFEFTAMPRASLATLNGAAVNFSAMLVDVDVTKAGAIDEFGALARAMPSQKLIAAAKGAGGDDVRRLFRAGAADVMTPPFDLAALRSAFFEVLQSAPVDGGTTGRLITVMKAGGGAGATTVALNLAHLMARGDARRKRRRRSTALLDLDLQQGGTDLALNMEPRSTLLDILGAEDRLDARFLQSVMSEHRLGLKLLAPPRSLLPLDSLTPSLAAGLVEHSTRLHELTFVDLPGAFTDWTIPILKRSDLIVLVAAPTVVSIMRARRTLNALHEAHIASPIFLVINQLAGLVDSLDKPARIGRSLELPVDATLGFDASATKAADRGELLVEAYPKIRLSREFAAAADKIDHRLAGAGKVARPAFIGEPA